MADIKLNRRHNAYIFSICKSQFNNKGSFISHLTRKTKCGVISNIDIINSYIDKFKTNIDDDTYILTLYNTKIKPLYNNLTDTEKETIKTIYTDGILEVINDIKSEITKPQSYISDKHPEIRPFQSAEY